jgi:predicted phage terminase large subunit-like protein
MVTAELIERYTPRTNKYIPHEPHMKQHAFLLLTQREAMYGGAAGGGKSDALLMAALQYVDVPGYAAILFRRTYADLSLPGALLDRAREWLGATDARWSEIEKTWHFPSGATVTFGYLDNENTKFRYQSAEFQFIGFDELTQFGESQYRYLFSRLRKPAVGPLANVPLRMRSASNPGGVGHEWVKRRFIAEGLEGGRVFLPARLADNPSLDEDEYVASLQELDPVTLQQLLNGDWTAAHTGAKFQRGWFELVDQAPEKRIRWCRFWDMASTEPKPGTDPDWTAGALVGLSDGIWYIKDIKRLRARPGDVEKLIAQCAILDPRGTAIRMEREPGASGVAQIDHYRRRVLVGRDFDGVPSTGNKEVRANPVSSAANAGNIKLVQNTDENGEPTSTWIGPYLDEAEAFPLGSHDDQVDAVSGAVNFLWRGLGGGGGQRKDSVWEQAGVSAHRNGKSGHRGKSVWLT